jgi:hypothetical protein
MKHLKAVPEKTKNDTLRDMIEQYRSITPDIDHSDMTLEREIGLQVVKTIPAHMSMYS